MPFDTVNRSQKQIGVNNTCIDELLNSTWGYAASTDQLSVESMSDFAYPEEASEYTSSGSPGCSQYSYGIADIKEESLSPTSSENTFTKSLDSTLSLKSDFCSVSNALSQFNLSYTDFGLHMEANIASASELRSLIEAFSQLCKPSYNVPNDSKYFDHSAVVHRNTSYKAKPANFFATASLLGQIGEPSPYKGKISLREIVDACIDTYFTCWVKSNTVLNKDEFMVWYNQQLLPEDTVIVNAICSFIFVHMVLHHPKSSISQILAHQDRVEEQEEFFFNRARDALSQTFDLPHRYTIVGLLLMSVRAEVNRCHHYIGMAVSMLHQLEIYPRMINDENEDENAFAKEMDTRLWWFVWCIDFSLYSAGMSKNTPQTRLPGKVSLPRIFEQDIDGEEHSVLAYTHCIAIWQIQADIVSAVYEKDTDMTLQQFNDYDTRLVNYRTSLPHYLQFDVGFEYGSEELLVACLRVNTELNATRILLHKLFLPETADNQPSQFSLQSLNVCLFTALVQLRIFVACHQSTFTRCAFDRDELWRSAEIISTAMDIYRNCNEEMQRLILTGISKAEFNGGLARALDIIQGAPEYKTSSKNWLQVHDWLQAEIRRHHMYGIKSIEVAKPLDYFFSSLKSSSKPTAHRNSRKKSKSPSEDAKSMLSVLSFPPVESSSLLNSGFLSTRISSEKKNTYSNSTPSVQFNVYTPKQKSTQHAGNTHSIANVYEKSQARFRYFNPRKMNKFLFIDEHPM
ncbi:hypothetical protein BDF14DRAFT_1784962 [Spinellus fusiger]|nr:hypothetical protein BDF14DRAFT_1784962 [Spinellus fusiger]